MARSVKRLSRFRLAVLLAGALCPAAVLAADPADTPARLVEAGAAVTPDAAGRYDLSALGFKAAPVAAAKPAGTFRILSIGDSYAYGITTSRYSYAAMLQDVLRREGREVEIVNLGIPSIGFPEYVAIYRFWAGRIEHDAVLFGVHAGTDWIDGDYAFPYRAAGERLLTDARILLTPKLVASLAPKGTPQRGLDKPPPPDPRYDSQVQFDAASYLDILRQWGRGYRPESFAALATGHALARRFLAVAAEISRAGKAVLVFVAPSPLAVSPEWRRKVADAESADAAAFDPYLPGALLGAIAGRDGGVPVVDLTACFAAAAQPESLYYGTNGHWSIAGNRLAADALAGAIRRRWFAEASLAETCGDIEMVPRRGAAYDWLSPLAGRRN